MSIRFTTDGVPRYRRLALWQDIVCDVYVKLDCTSDLGSDFHGSVTHAPLGRATCSEVSSQRQRVYRTRSRIARADEDFFLIALGKHGVGGVVQDGRDTVIHRGEFAIYDTTRPSELQFDHSFTQTILQIPRDMLHARIAGTERLTAISFDSDRPLAKIARDFVEQLCQNADQIAPEHAIPLSEQAIDLVAMALSERLTAQPLPSTHRCALRCRLKAHIHAHLADPELSLAATAAALGFSPRYLNDLLSDEETWFQRFVLTERLALANAISPPRVSPIDRSAKLRLHGALTTCRISDRRFANIMACRRANGGAVSCRTSSRSSIKNRQVAPLKQGTRMSAL